MGRTPKAWLPGAKREPPRPGKVINRGRELPGYYVYWHVWTNGQRTLHSRCFSTLKNARLFMRRHNAKRELGDLDQVTETLLPDAAAEFNASIAGLREDTQRGHRVALNFLCRLAGDVPVHAITGSDLDRFVSWRMKESAESTVNKHIRNLNKFFKWCIQKGYCHHNPNDGLTSKPRSLPRERPPVTEAQLAALVKACPDERYRAAVLLAMTTGLDRSKLAMMTPAHIDFEHAVIPIVRQKTGK